MFAISAGTKRQNFRGLTQLQQPNRKSRAGWFMCVCVLVFRLSRWVGQCVVLAERRGRRGHDPPLPLPPPAPVWKKWWVFFFFFSGVSSRSLGHQQPIRDGERMRRRWRDKGVYQMGESQHDEDESLCVEQLWGRKRPPRSWRPVTARHHSWQTSKHNYSVSLIILVQTLDGFRLFFCQNHLIFLLSPLLIISG